MILYESVMLYSIERGKKVVNDVCGNLEENYTMYFYLYMLRKSECL